MKAINLYLLCQVQPPDTFADYARILTREKTLKGVRENEQGSLHALVADLRKARLPYEAFDGFFFSFNIDHIGKEFDLLKIKADRSRIVNIELKSEMTGEARIRHQLIQNRYYLGHITKNVESFTYVSSDRKIFRLNEADELTESSMAELREVLTDTEGWLGENIEDLFAAEDYLISPIATPQKFVEGMYFLTQQQETYKNQILKLIAERDDRPLFLGLKGSPGTGKTLMIYDMARELAARNRVIIVHCGQLTEAHLWLKERGWDIFPVNRVGKEELEAADLVFVDESQRLRQDQFALIRDTVEYAEGVCLFAYDPRQVLLYSELERNISGQIDELTEITYRLSEKIRANKELASFLRVLLESRTGPDDYSYRNIDVVYAATPEEGNIVKKAFISRGYRFINFTSEGRGTTSFDRYGGEMNTHKAIGQEFSDVVMILDDTFYYDGEGILKARAHPNPDYIYEQLLYQGVTRTREKLCLIVVDNFELFSHVTGLIRDRYF